MAVLFEGAKQENRPANLSDHKIKCDRGRCDRGGATGGRCDRGRCDRGTVRQGDGSLVAFCIQNQKCDKRTRPPVALKGRFKVLALVDIDSAFPYQINKQLAIAGQIVFLWFSISFRAEITLTLARIRRLKSARQRRRLSPGTLQQGIFSPLGPLGNLSRPTFHGARWRPVSRGS